MPSTLHTATNMSQFSTNLAAMIRTIAHRVASCPKPCLQTHGHGQPTAPEQHRDGFHYCEFLLSDIPSSERTAILPSQQRVTRRVYIDHHPNRTLKQRSNRYGILEYHAVLSHLGSTAPGPKQALQFQNIPLHEASSSSPFYDIALSVVALLLAARTVIRQVKHMWPPPLLHSALAYSKPGVLAIASPPALQRTHLSRCLPWNSRRTSPYPKSTHQSRVHVHRESR